jgi:hypothetical protein
LQKSHGSIASINLDLDLLRHIECAILWEVADDNWVVFATILDLNLTVKRVEEQVANVVISFPIGNGEAGVVGRENRELEVGAPGIFEWKLVLSE